MCRVTTTAAHALVVYGEAVSRSCAGPTAARAGADCGVPGGQQTPPKAAHARLRRQQSCSRP